MEPTGVNQQIAKTAGQPVARPQARRIRIRLPDLS